MIKILFVVGLVFMGVTAWIVADRIQFLQNSVETNGIVESYETSKSTCSRRRRSIRRTCWRLDAVVKYFTPNNQDYRLRVLLKKSRNQNPQYTGTNYLVGKAVPVVYARDNPSRAYENSFLAIWGPALITFIFMVVTTCFSFFAHKQGQEEDDSDQ